MQWTLGSCVVVYVIRRSSDWYDLDRAPLGYDLHAIQLPGLFTKGIMIYSEKIKCASLKSVKNQVNM